MRGRRDIPNLFFKATCLAGLLFMLVCSAQAQQDPVYSQYMNNLQSVNAGYTGVRGSPTISTIFRKQWLGLNGAPTTSSLTFSMPFDSTKTSLGIDFLYDYTLPSATAALFVNYGYRFRVTENVQASLGLKAGFNYLEAKLTDLYRYHIDDSYILTYGDFYRFMPNFGVGGFLYGENFYLGFAVPRILQNSYNKENNIFTTKSREERHYFLHGAYSFPLSDLWTFQPAVTTIMVAGAPITADFDLAFHYTPDLTLGALYRISDGFGAYVQFEFEHIRFGFSYDYGHTRLQHYNNGTFEVMLRFDLKPRIKEVSEGIIEGLEDSPLINEN